MNVLVLGGGGREQAIAWACRRRGHNAEVSAELPDEVRADLVIVGPEALLASGVADECARRGIPCFGPTAALARLESSKGFARDLATKLGLPGPRYARFDSASEAIAWWRETGCDVVVKADGLAAGKGVVVPNGAQQTIAAIEEMAARGPFVVEERMTGPECTLMALCDGSTALPLPLAQDHKRIHEGDSGPNTGGMGAYAPAPLPYGAEELADLFIRPVIAHLAAAGTPYIGVLYAGLMLTPQGPRLVEFNCRFGDPEAQAVLPLLAGDLAQLALTATRGELARHTVELLPGAVCTVVAAAAGYPAEPVVGSAVDGLEPLETDGATVFLAGCRDGVTTGGRVLAVSGYGPDLGAARANAYARMEHIRFDGMQVRNDVAWRAAGATIASYAATGVDIDEGTRAVTQMKRAVEATHGPAVLRGVGSFGGAFSGAALKAMADPVLVASTDGVGTKVELAARLQRYRGVGVDIVNHCINDVLVQGARPLFFLDYVASSKLDADHVAEVVSGMAEACSAAGCALLGGETAEMPGVYADGAFDIAGTLVGAVERAAMLPNGSVAADDVLVGIASNGPHTNGYSLLRKVFQWTPLDVVPEGWARSLADALLEPHRSYLPVLERVIGHPGLKALAHITGGGLPENLPRILPPGIDAVVQLGSWPVPPLFQLVRELTPRLDTIELYRTLNMGVGMVLVCAAAEVDAVRACIDEPAWVIGELCAGAGKVHLR